MPTNKDGAAVSHEGHRQRMKERYLTSGLAGFSSHEVLELLLFYALPYKDTNGLAHQLIDSFGSLPNVLEADYADLIRQPGVTPHLALLFTLTRDICRRYQTELAGQVIQLCGTPDYIRRLKPWFLGDRKESIVLLSLDNKRKLLNTSRVMTGSVSISTFNIRLVVQQALQDNATAVVLAHNHPSGFAFPSKEDVSITKQLVVVLESMDIQLLDHIVVAENDCLSMAELYRSTGDFHTDIRLVQTENEP